MKVADLLTNVGANVDGCAETVAKRVVDALTEKEVSARTDAFMAVLGKLEAARGAAKKIKPDGETWAVGEDGTPAATSVKTFSKAKLEELKKNREEQAKLEDALNKALGGDFAKVKEIAAKGGSKPDEG